MKANFLALGLFGLAGASAVLPRDDYKHQDGYKPAEYKPTGYKPADYKPADYKPAGYKPVEYKPKPTKPSYPVKSYPTKAPKYEEDYATSPVYADEDDYETGYDYKNSKGRTSSWKPKSKSPEFFNLRVDEKCNIVDGVAETGADCAFNGYAIRLEGGIFIATPYNKWWDPKLPTFFVDDDTQLYTVSYLRRPRHRTVAKQIHRLARTLSRSTLMALQVPSSTPRSAGSHPTPLPSAFTTLVTTLLALSTPVPPISAGPARRAVPSSAAPGFSALSAVLSSTKSSSTARTSALVA